MIRRGQIWWADLAEPRGSKPGDRHPVLVLQRDEVNASRINTVVVCRLTSNAALARAPGNTLLSRRRTDLRRDSVANASQVATLNRPISTHWSVPCPAISWTMWTRVCAGS